MSLRMASVGAGGRAQPQEAALRFSPLRDSAAVATVRAWGWRGYGAGACPIGGLPLEGAGTAREPGDRVARPALMVTGGDRNTQARTRFPALCAKVRFAVCYLQTPWAHSNSLKATAASLCPVKKTQAYRSFPSFLNPSCPELPSPLSPLFKTVFYTLQKFRFFLEGGACSAKHGGNGGTETRRDFGWSVCWRSLRTRKTQAKRLRGTFLDARSSSLQTLRVSFLRALRVLRRRQKRKESERACPMGGRSLSDQHSGIPPLPA